MSELIGINAQLKKILDQYAEQVDKTCEECAKITAKDAVELLKTNSPPKDKTGKYAKSWTATKVKGKYIVHNKNHYQLTHLLNNGHDIVNAYGAYGHWNGDNHIGNVEAQVVEKYIKRVEEKL